MGLINRLLHLLGYERRSIAAADFSDSWGYATRAGIMVTEEGALRCSAVLACVRIIAESIAQLPLILYRRTSTGRERAASHPLFALLHDRPNTEHTSYELREYLATSLLLWGNGFALIERDAASQPTALWPVHPARVEVKVGDDGRLQYLYKPRLGDVRPLDRSQVLHVRGLSLDGVTGISPIAYAREAVGLALATEEASARFWRRGGAPMVGIKIPGLTQPETWEKWRDAIQRHRASADYSGMQVLPAEWTVEKIGIPPQDAEYVETRKFQVLEIARIFRVPPHKLGILERASYASIEQQSMEYVQETLMPWLVRIEQAIRRDVLPPWEPDLYAEHLLDGLLRGDTESRYRAYAVARQWGWMSINDIRERENLPRIEGGDAYLVPLNMVEVSNASN